MTQWNAVLAKRLMGIFSTFFSQTQSLGWFSVLPVSNMGPSEV